MKYIKFGLATFFFVVAVTFLTCSFIEGHFIGSQWKEGTQVGFVIGVVVALISALYTMLLGRAFDDE